MDRKIIGRLAVGTAAALCLTSAPVVLASAASGASAATRLTGPQARAAINAAMTATEKRALKVGTRQTSRTTSSEKRIPVPNPGLNVFKVDPARHTVSVESTSENNIAGHGYSATDPCDPGSTDSSRSQYVSIVKAGVGGWERLRPTANEKAGLKLLKRTPARWRQIPRPKATLKGTFHGWSGSLRNNFLAGYAMVDGISQSTANGRHYSIKYQDTTGYAFERGTITLDVDTHGALVKYVNVNEFTIASPHVITTTTWRATYGAQHVPAPTAKRSVTKKTLARGCRAAVAKKLPQSLAKSAAKAANDGAKSAKQPVTVALIRREVAGRNLGATYGIDVKVTKIAGGSRIVARNKLLKRSSVSTVVLEDGKAVAHKVR